MHLLEDSLSLEHKRSSPRLDWKPFSRKLILENFYNFFIATHRKTTHAFILVKLTQSMHFSFEYTIK